MNNTKAFTFGFGVTFASPILMLISLRRHWLWEPSTIIISVFSFFSLSFFTVFQDRTLAIQFAMVLTWKLRMAVSFTPNLPYIFVSSANPWPLMACCLLFWVVEGTPGREEGREQILRTLPWTVAYLTIHCYWFFTAWVRPLRYDCIHEI